MTQAQALTILQTGANVFLTGEPGAGKSHTTRAYVAWLREHCLEPAITASTGIAATHIGGMTIHSWAGIGIKKSLSQYDLDRIASTEHVVKRVRRTKILIIDEVSMLGPETLGMVDAVCRTILSSSRPFGGLQVVLVGDFFQLPPIQKNVQRAANDDLFEESAPRFAYSSPAWRALNPLVCYLQEQHRHEDPTLSDILAAIRTGQFDEDMLEPLAARKVDGLQPPKDAPRLFSHNANVDEMNTKMLAALEGIPRSFAMRGQGAPALVESLKKSCLSPETLFLKVGASVIFTKNNPKEGYVNGSLGKVASFNPFNKYPIVRLLNGREVEAEPAEWSIEENGVVRARVTQIPLRLAWAITVHKSQGMSLDAAVMDLSQVFEYGQGYVALSRVRSLSGLYLLGWNARTFEVHPDVLEKDEQFRSASDTAAEAFEKMPAEELKTMHENFIKACGGTLEISSPKVAEQTPYMQRLEKLREKHPNAYRPWSDEDDEKLKELFEQGTSPAQLSKEFGRQRGSINARLLKLGLIEE